MRLSRFSVGKHSGVLEKRGRVTELEHGPCLGLFASTFSISCIQEVDMSNLELLVAELLKSPREFKFVPEHRRSFVFFVLGDVQEEEHGLTQYETFKIEFSVGWIFCSTEGWSETDSVERWRERDEPDFAQSENWKKLQRRIQSGL